MDELLNNLDDLKAKFARAGIREFDDTFRQWETDYKRAFLQDDLSNHDAVKMLIDKFTKEIEQIKYLLENSDSTQLPDVQRDTVIARKKIYEDFLSFFAVAQVTKEVIETQVEENTQANQNIQ
jgi:uncharacterized protein YukE